MKVQIDHGIFDYCGAKVRTSELLVSAKVDTPAASGVSGLLSPGAIVWSLAASGSQTLSDNGQRSAYLRAVQALTEAQRLDYERSIRAAMRDVEDVLAARDAEVLRQNALTAALAASHTAVARAARERRAGTIGTVDLLTTQRSLYTTEGGLAISRADRLRQIVTLTQIARRRLAGQLSRSYISRLRDRLWRGLPWDRVSSFALIHGGVRRWQLSQGWRRAWYRGVGDQSPHPRSRRSPWRFLVPAIVW